VHEVEGRAKRRRRLVRAAAVAAFLGGGLLFWADRTVAAAGEGRIHDVDSAPRADIALVLGTSPATDGRTNSFFEARLDAAAALWRAGTVRGFLLSGDNSRGTYDEPSCMRDGLVARGVPVEALTCDFAGRSTLDSIGRAGPVFGQRRVLLVSQRFHLERALYLARAAGLEADGVAAADAARPFHFRARVRETFARAKAVLDVALGRTPWVLGPRVEVALAPPR
jgi:SanA protein